MLYEFELTDGSPDALHPLPFYDLESVDRIEKDLEDLLAGHLIDILFEEAPLMPFFQQRSWQSEADLYALNEKGDLVIFELKRGDAGASAVHQVLRYAQEAGQWSYEELAKRYDKYQGESELAEAHRDGFELDESLDHGLFNRQQHLRIVGNAADTELVNAVNYWHRKGVDISFLPYRIYEISGKYYFEFFSKPNDQHSNPAEQKGVLFDTNKSWDKEALWDMIDKKRIAAYGGASRYADYIGKDDIVFYSHKGHGLVAAAKVVSETKQGGPDEKYHDVEFLTPVPKRDQDIRAMSFSKVSDVTGETFFWARTLKVPYLTYEQANELLEALQEELRQGSKWD